MTGVAVRNEKKRILVADDEPEIRSLLAVLFGSEGWLIVEAASGQEALEHSRRFAFDVVVLDHRMPGMSGIEAARRIAAEGFDGPIIVFSAYLSPEVLAECDKTGALPGDKLDTDGLVEACRSLGRRDV